MASTPKGYSGAVIENASGIQALLPPTAVSALPAGLTNSIPSAAQTSGMLMVIAAYGYTATGTVTVAGTAPLSGGAVTETTNTFDLADEPGWVFFRTTKTAYATVTASTGVSATGLTGGTVAIWGVQAARKMITGEFKLTKKRTEHVVITQDGSFAESRMPALTMTEENTWEFQGDYFPDDLEWIIECGVNSAPSVANLPNSGVAVLGATSVVTGSSVSASLQPTAPGMVLVAVLSGGPASAATVTVAGVDIFGETVTETLVPSTKANGTYYGQITFQSINSSGITYGAFGGAASLTITGYFGWQLTASTADTLGSFCAYQYDGVGNYVAPWCLVDEWEISGGADKEMKAMAKGPCQAVFLVGDTTSATQQGPSLAQPPDMAITGFTSLHYLDNISGTAGTTQLQQVMEWKVNCKNKWKTTKTQAFNPPLPLMAKADRGRREIRVELKVYMDSTTYDAQYRRDFEQRKRKLYQMQIVGRPLLGTTGGTTYYAGWTVTAPLKFAEEPKREYTLSGEFVTLTLTGVAYKPAAIGYDLQIIPNTRVQAWNQ